MALMTGGEVLRRFAAYGEPASVWQVFGEVRQAQGPTVAELVHELRDAGLLRRLDHATHADVHGGHQFEVTRKGYESLGLTPPKPAAAGVKHIPSRNRGKRLGFDSPQVANGRRKVG